MFHLDCRSLFCVIVSSRMTIAWCAIIHPFQPGEPAANRIGCKRALWGAAARRDASWAAGRAGGLGGVGDT